MPLVVACLFWPDEYPLRWTALGLFTLAAVTDFFDGYLARIWDQQSALGRMLDPIADKLLVSAVLLILVADGTIKSWSLWAAIVILCREILVSGLREFLAELKVSVPVSKIAKWKTTVQLVALGFPHRRTGGRAGAAGHGADRPGAAVDGGDSDPLYRLGLFPKAGIKHVVEE